MNFEERDELMNKMHDTMMPLLNGVDTIDGRIVLMGVAENCLLMALLNIPQERQIELMNTLNENVAYMIQSEKKQKN